MAVDLPAPEKPVITTRSCRCGRLRWVLLSAGRVAAMCTHCDAHGRRVLPQGSEVRCVGGPMRRTIAIAFAVAATLVAAPAALAEPAQKGAVGAEQTTFKWTGQAYG